MMCIYKIINKENGKVYIGRTTNYKTRKTRHLYLLKTNQHPNLQLQEDYNKYGKEAFTFEVVEECAFDTLDEKEKYWISQYGSREANGNYNVLKGGIGGVGDEEWKKNISKKVKQNYANGLYDCRRNFICVRKNGAIKHIKPEELGQYIDNGWEKGGHIPTSESIEKIKRTKEERGIVNPFTIPEIIEKIKAKKKGKPSKLKGRKLSEERKRKVSMSKMGHTVSTETRLKLSIAAKEHYRKKREGLI